ncbi:hypothetical protein NDU88_003514 [Pleurodeles waltl]|uniref:Uncharacterized protein n=1 Tax=Pleurodeles waltl TaxID=8319 RepID=A0AAV7UD07_PLEWA|nr:hypothetical protein NDU88_003514 [Pleurodeles waltl]
MPADLDLLSSSATLHNTSSRPLAHSRPPRPAGLHQSTKQVPPPLRGGPLSAPAQLLLRPPAQPGCLRTGVTNSTSAAGSEGPRGLRGPQSPRGPLPVPGTDQAFKTFLAPGTACSPGVARRRLPALRSARVGSGSQPGLPTRVWTTAPAPIAATTASKMTAGHTRGLTQVRSSQHRLQEK